MVILKRQAFVVLLAVNTLYNKYMSWCQDVRWWTKELNRLQIMLLSLLQESHEQNHLYTLTIPV